MMNIVRKASSCRRRPASRFVSIFTTNSGWIPAFAGMTNLKIREVRSCHKVHSVCILFFLTLNFVHPLNLERASAQANFYQGKTITIVVTSTAGGGYDLWGRLTARHIGKHIPGNPSIVVQNMPGAGNIIGANYVYGIAKPDGLTLGAVNPALYFDQLVGPLRSKIRLGEIQLDRLAGKKRHRLLHARRPAVQIYRRFTQRQGAGQMRQHRHRLHRPLHSPSARRNSRHQNSHRQRLSRRRRISNSPSSAAKCSAGRRCSPPTSAASPIGAGINPVTCAS